MNIILLSGGSGKRLWPLSNDIRSKQYIKIFKDEKVQEVVMIGTIKRPSFFDLVPDLRTASFFAKVGAKSLGDDGILRALIKEIESEGIVVRGIHEVMPDLLIKQGVLGKIKPSKQAKLDLKRGIEVATALGKLDVGQAVVVQQGLVLGLEGIEGTAELLHRCKDYRRKGSGGVLVKIRKPQQDMRYCLFGYCSDTRQRNDNYA